MEDSEKDTVSKEGVLFIMRKKINSEEKYTVVRQILRGEMSQRYAAEILGVHWSSVQAWVRLYEAEGAAALERSVRNCGYSAKTKQAAVQEYLSGKGSLSAVCKKYHIRSNSTLKRWIKVYNAHGRFTSKRSGGSYMRKSRKTTQEERLKIAKECLENGKDYGAMALKYQVSYQQVRTWTLRYAEQGEAGLEDRRGKRKASQEPRTELERLQIENERLKHALYMAEMERDLLKKLEEIERGDSFHK